MLALRGAIRASVGEIAGGGQLACNVFGTTSSACLPKRHAVGLI